MRTRNIVLLICCAIYFLAMFQISSLSVLSLDIMRDLGMTTSTVGLLGGSLMIAHGIMNLPSGIMADYFGARKTVAWLTALAGLSSLAFALSPNAQMAVAARFVLGLGVTVTVPMYTLLARWFSPGSYGRAASIFSASAGVGTLIAGSPLYLMNSAMGWRVTLILFSVITLALAAFCLFMLPENPHEPAGEINIPKEKTTARNVLLSLKTVLTTRGFWPLCLWQVFMGGSMFTLIGMWWVPYLVQGCGFSTAEASVALLAASLTIFAAQPLLATLSDVVFKSRRWPVMLASALAIPASISLVVLCGKMSFAVMLAQAVFITIGFAAAAPLVFAMVKETFPGHQTGTALGCVSMIFPIWSAVSQSLFGAVVQWRMAATNGDAASAYTSAAMLLMMNAVLGFVCCLFMKETFEPVPAFVAADGKS